MTQPNADTIRLWPGWFKGDFHAHTNHSDGWLTPPQLLAHARDCGLDFFTSTDHNLISAHDQFGDHPDMLIIRGVEVTMRYGHFNVFGLNEHADWLDTLPTTREAYTAHMQTGETTYTPTELMQITKKAGLYNSVNHPLLEPWEWRDGDTDLRYVDFLEIWNDPTWPDNDIGNPEAIALWTRLLNAGHRLTAIGGTDLHDIRPKPQPDGTIIAGDRLNQPTTYVYAPELSTNGIMIGLKNRHAYVTMEPEIAFGLTIGDQTAMLGDDLGNATGTATLQASTHGTGTLTLQLLRNGDIISAATATNAVCLQHTITLDGTTPAWFRIDIRDSHNNFLAVSNPIFTGTPIEPTDNRIGAFL